MEAQSLQLRNPAIPPVAALPHTDETGGVARDARYVTHWSRVLHYDWLGTCTRRADVRAGRDVAGAAPAVLPARESRPPSARPGAPEQLTLTAADGYPIAATRYTPSGPVRAHLVVAGAIGVPQRFYRRFAEYAVSTGYAVLTFDYRGIGRSAPASLAGFRMNYFDWGRQDLAAAVAAMTDPQRPLHVMGHSFGGHGFGMLPNHPDVAGFYTFGIGAGWHGWMPPLERVKVLALWHLLGPLLTWRTGYLAWSRVGMGEDLPLDFYRQWKHWCRFPNYFLDDPLVRPLLRGYYRLRAPLMAANSIDDRWATPASRDAFIAGYRNARRHTLDIDPAQAGLARIGHMGYFRADATSLWASALAWLEPHRQPGGG